MLYGFWIDNKDGQNTERGVITATDEIDAKSQLENVIDPAVETVEVGNAEEMINDHFDGLAYCSVHRVGEGDSDKLIETEVEAEEA